MNLIQPRRQFVRTFVLGTAFSSLLGQPWQATVLAAVTPGSVGLLRVKVSDYPALQQNNGSVRLGVNPIEGPLPAGPFYPILINHTVGATYHAMSTYCSHAGCVVNPFDDFENAVVCPCHGSRFSMSGALISNGPASGPLERYDIDYDGNDLLTIKVPGLGYCVNTALVPGTGTPRLRLEFPTFEVVEYEVRFRQHITDAWAVVSFALSESGPANQTVLTGDGNAASVFVNRTAPTGFFSVAIKVIDLTNG